MSLRLSCLYVLYMLGGIVGLCLSIMSLVFIYLHCQAQVQVRMRIYVCWFVGGGEVWLGRRKLVYWKGRESRLVCWSIGGGEKES